MIKNPDDRAAIDAMIDRIGYQSDGHAAVLEAYELGYERAAKIALDAQQAEEARKLLEKQLDELEVGVVNRRCTMRFALASAARVGIEYLRSLPESERPAGAIVVGKPERGHRLEFPGGTVDTSGMKPEPAAPTTLTDEPEACIK